MLRLERLRADHGPAVLAFERTNRAYFARSVTDRGEEYFAHFDDHLARLLGDQEAGGSAFYVLVDDCGVVGRFNLYDIGAATATVGYRVAERVAGAGVATGGLRALCEVAAGLGLTSLSAAVAEANHASRRVLLKAGFVPDGRADPAELGGRGGERFRCDLGPDA